MVDLPIRVRPIPKNNKQGVGWLQWYCSRISLRRGSYNNSVIKRPHDQQIVLHIQARIGNVAEINGLTLCSSQKDKSKICKVPRRAADFWTKFTRLFFYIQSQTRYGFANTSVVRWGQAVFKRQMIQYGATWQDFEGAVISPIAYAVRHWLPTAERPVLNQATWCEVSVWWSRTWTGVSSV
jgi:hypothetical protein